MFDVDVCLPSDNEFQKSIYEIMFNNGKLTLFGFLIIFGLCCSLFLFLINLFRR